MENEQTLTEYKPYYILGKTGNTIYYKRSWYCNENKMIHGSEREVRNCKFCFSTKKEKNRKMNTQNIFNTPF